MKPTDNEIGSLAVAAPGDARFPDAALLPFSSFNNRYSGASCHIVGRGPTRYEYESLARVDGPVFFINDAICLEKYVAGESFFFAHDRQMRVWLDGRIKSTAVLPVNGKVLVDAEPLVFAHSAGVIYYRRGEQNKKALLGLSRSELSERGELFVHTGTIHSLLHFVWFCGFERAVFIGCDGMNNDEGDGYDPRLENRSQSGFGNYSTIRKAQDLLTTLFNIRAVYLGTPR